MSSQLLQTLLLYIFRYDYNIAKLKQHIDISLQMKNICYNIYRST